MLPCVGYRTLIVNQVCRDFGGYYITFTLEAI